VQIESGAVRPPARNELLVLSSEQLARGLRLACQLVPEDDLKLRIVNTVTKFSWRDLAPENLPCGPARWPPSAWNTGGGAYGLAIDLGTTQISLSVRELRQGRRIHACVGPNPQCLYGLDVVTRLMAACGSPEDARRLAMLPLEAVAEALLKLGSQDGFAPSEIVRATIVGNTAMLALITGADSGELLQPGNWTRALEQGVEHAKSWASVLGIHPQATVEAVQSLGGFVGSDLLAGVVATRLTEQPGSLLIDFGTNSEMALWDGQTLWVSSAAGGPAFESSGMQCGMPAEPGAIYRFGGAAGADGLHFEVLGGADAKGFCGSGLVDLIACLRESGELTRTGGFVSPEHKDGYVVLHTEPPIRLTKKDVDAFQRAKAAIGAGIGTLLARARMRATELSRICVCGVFGQNLNVRNAQRIGLLPDIAPGQVEMCGNAALCGCEHMLLSTERGGELARLRKQAVVLNLSQSDDFDDLFMENLYLQPMEVEKR
jgi:uncharacterized 2Fe-2S/4Fe-4S cluster protein (DUF4445 family)